MSVCFHRELLVLGVGFRMLKGFASLNRLIVLDIDKVLPTWLKLRRITPSYEECKSYISLWQSDSAASDKECLSMMAQQLKQHLYMSAGAVATVSESSARLGFGTSRPQLSDSTFATTTLSHGLWSPNLAFLCWPRTTTWRFCSPSKSSLSSANAHLGFSAGLRSTTRDIKETT